MTDEPTGFFAGLTEEQKEKALSCTEDHNIGNDNYLDDLLNHGNGYWKRRIIECDCHEPFHQVILDFDPEEREVMIYTQMKNYLPWYKRLLAAFKYVFLLDTTRIDYVEALVSSKKELEMIRDFFDRASKNVR